MSRRTTNKRNPLDKKIPENPKYKHIKATIDTGASLSKYLEHLEDLRQNYRFRKDEIFKRLKVTTFVQLVIQVAVDQYNDDDDDVETSTPLHPDDSPPDTARSTLNSIVHGIGELDISNEEDHFTTTPPNYPPSSPYLLLDVRDSDEYQQCHIISAKSYPITMLSRSCNYFTQDILDYMNKSGKIIILYDNNERIAQQAATVFVQRGVDNVFLLSGGIKVLHKMFPQGIITGALPPSCLPTPPMSSRRSHRAPHHSPPLIPSPPTHPVWPSPGDIAVLQDQLDTVLLSSEPSSSRASSRSTASRAEPSRAGSSRYGGSGRGGGSRASTSASMYSSPTVSASSRVHTPWK